MKLIAEPVGEQVDWYGGTEIGELDYGASGLRIAIAGAIGCQHRAEVQFADPVAFQALRESDMQSYWAEPLGSGCFVYRVHSGGWVDRTRGHYFEVSSEPEWLVVADTGLVVSVVAVERPVVRVY